MKGKALKLAAGLVAATMLAAPHALAQAPGLTGMGLKVGLNLANAYGDDAEMPGYDKKSRTGICGGVFVEYSLCRIIAIQPEILYSMKGVVNELDLLGGLVTSKLTTKVDYLEIPLLVKARIPTEGSIKPNVFVGPALGILLSAELLSETSALGLDAPDVTTDIKDETKSTDIGLVAGLGVALPAGATKVTLDVRYNLGLTSNDDSALDLDVKNSVISAMMGICF